MKSLININNKSEGTSSPDTMASATGTTTVGAGSSPAAGRRKPSARQPYEIDAQSKVLLGEAVNV